MIDDASGDGVSVSVDGNIVYLENGGITAYSIATGAFLANYNNPLLAGVDGTGVINSSKT